jgi:hypothetical protein
MSAEYGYDADDRRTMKIVNGVMTRTLWSDGEEIAQYSATGALLRIFTPDGTGASDAASPGAESPAACPPTTPSTSGR